MSTPALKTPTRIKELTIRDYVMPNGKSVDFQLSYEIFGRPLNHAPVILVSHALTGNSRVTGPNGWWNQLIGYGQTVDCNKFTVITFNIPGNGYGRSNDKLPVSYRQFSAAIVADLFWKGLEQLNVHHLFAAIGCSLGGGIVWEMAFQKPKAIEHLIPIATNLRASEWLIGQAYIQDEILNFCDDSVPYARMHAMMLYRTPKSFDTKFKEKKGIEGWLQYHGKTLQERFSLSAYKINNHLLKTIGENQTEGELLNFAKQTTAQIHCIAVDSDYLFTWEEQKETCLLLKKHCDSVTLETIYSVHGHDAFLIEYEQLNNLLKPLFSNI